MKLIIDARKGTALLTFLSEVFDNVPSNMPSPASNVLKLLNALPEPVKQFGNGKIVVFAGSVDETRKIINLVENIIKESIDEWIQSGFFYL